MTLPEIPAVVYGVLGPIPVRFVVDLSEEGDEAFGVWEPETRTIAIRSGMSREMEWATLEHELVHAALFEVGVVVGGDLEERICNSIAAQRVAAMRERAT